MLSAKWGVQIAGMILRARSKADLPVWLCLISRPYNYKKVLDKNTTLVYYSTMTVVQKRRESWNTIHRCRFIYRRQIL